MMLLSLGGLDAHDFCFFFVAVVKLCNQLFLCQLRCVGLRLVHNLLNCVEADVVLYKS